MEYAPNTSYVKNVAIPRYPPINPYQGQRPQYEPMKPSANSAAFQNNAAFLDNSQYVPIYHDFDEARSRQIQNRNEWQYQALKPSLKSTHANSTPVQAINTKPSLDYHFILLSLAEDYFAIAHGEGSLTALVRGEMDMQTYYKLIATGLGCLEAVLKHWRLQPQLEATVRLRYATVLHEETENSTVAEEALSKGIIICDRHKMFDLKYNMQHLLTRVLFKVNPRASLKFLDGIINDVEAYQHVAWVYAFRFLRVSLSFELSTHQDTLSAFTHLKRISAIAKYYGDKAVIAIASTIEAMAHLRQSNSNEDIEQAQRSLADARSCQLDPLVASLPQLAALMQFIDLCSTLRKFDPNQAVSKMQAMQSILEPFFEASSTENGVFAIPICRSPYSSSGSTGGVIQNLSDGGLGLMFNWLPGEDIYLLGFLLSGIALAHDNQRAEKMFREGLKTREKALTKSDRISESIIHSVSRQAWRQSLKCYLQLNLTFTLCARTAWPEAQDQLRQLKESAATLSSATSFSLTLLILYLEGVIYQGTGALTLALQIFQSPSFALPPNNTSRLSPLQLELSILSALNTLLIIRSPTHPHHILLTPLLNSLQSIPTSLNKSLQAAYNLLLATASPTSTIVRTKQHLQSALQGAKQLSNNQLMCMTLNFMAWKFFKGVVGEQAEKSARASQNLAKKGKDRLWSSVAAGVLGDTLEVMGRAQEAEQVRLEGMDIARSLPAGLLSEMSSIEAN